MGENLVLNMETRGYTVAVFNRTTSQGGRVRRTAAARARSSSACHSPKELVASAQAAAQGHDDGQGRASRWTTSSTQLAPLLEKGDILIDGGNTHFPDTERRMKDVDAKGLLYIGTGVSGGEEGALKGPSIMPGGDPTAWPRGEADLPGDRRQGRTRRQRHPVLRLGRPGRGRPLREDGPQRHRVRRHAAHLRGVPADEGPARPDATTSCTRCSPKWNKGELDSYLIEITARHLQRQGPGDAASRWSTRSSTRPGQKGTGKWTVDRATENGVAATLIAEAVFARCLSALKDERVRASKVLAGPGGQKFDGDQQAVHRRRAAGALRLARSSATPRATCRCAAQAKASKWAAQQRRHRADVARRLHHPQRVPRQDQGGVRPQPEAGEPAARSVLRGRDRPGAGRLAARGRRPA